MGFCTALIEAFTGVLFAELRRRAKGAFGLRRAGDAHPGLVVFVQRSDGALRLNVHLHVLALDGVYVRESGGTLPFHALPPPTPAEVKRVAARMHGRLARLCAKHGVAGVAQSEASPGSDASEGDAETALLVCIDAASRDVSLFGERAGERTEKRRVAVRALEGRGVREASPFVAEHGGVNVHAGVMVHGRDRAGLERLCRYVTRPPIALERLTERDDGCVEYAFRKPWRDGTRAVVLTEEDFMARICAMVPPPRFHLTRYAGVLAPNAKLRAEVVPRASEAGREAATSGPTNTRANEQGELFGEARGGEGVAESGDEARVTRHPWAWLLKRVFAAEVLVCVHCAGRLRLVEIATEPEATRRIAREERRRRGEPESPVEARASPRGPPGQLSFTFR